MKETYVSVAIDTLNHYVEAVHAESAAVMLYPNSEIQRVNLVKSLVGVKRPNVPSPVTVKCVSDQAKYDENLFSL